MNRLLILAEDADKYTTLVKAAGLPHLKIVAATGREDALKLILECNIVLGEPLLIREVLAAAKHLDWVQSSWAGVERLCRPELRHDYFLTGVKDIFGPLITEYVITYLFALERQIFEMREEQSKGEWKPGTYRLAKDITLGIAGLGSIGKHLAKVAGAFGLRVIGLNRSGDACEEVEKVFTEENLAGFFFRTGLPGTHFARHPSNPAFCKCKNPGHDEIIFCADQCWTGRYYQ